MSLSITGEIKEILPVESGVSKATDKEWKRQGFVIDTGAQYNPEVYLGLFGQEKIDMLANFKVGQHVDVAFNLSSRRWEKEGKVSYFTSCDVWKMDLDKSITPMDEAPVMAAQEDDLPF